jgi:hypothetical protein
MCPCLVATLLGAIAAVVDVAPAAAVIPARIDEQPATAILIRTLTHPLTVFGGHQVQRGECEVPEGRVQSILVETPLPFELTGTAYDLHAAGGTRQRRIEDRQIIFCRGLVSRLRNEDPIDRLAQFQ